MEARAWSCLAFASCIVLGCAEGYPITGSSESAALSPSMGGGGGGGAGGAAGVPSTGDTAGVGSMATPCTQNDVLPCPCEGSAAMGQRICVFDVASPTQGFFSDQCEGCLSVVPMPSCTDAMQNGAETGVDCGGPDCMPCPMSPAGSGGASGGGGSSGAGGSGGEAGSSGQSGSGGGDEPTGPVESCEGVPRGTECNRRCILPGNTARCNADGDCSCLS